MNQENFGFIPEQSLTGTQAITRAKIELNNKFSEEFDQLNTRASTLVYSIEYINYYITQLQADLSREEALTATGDQFGQSFPDGDDLLPESILAAITLLGAYAARLYELVEYRKQNSQSLTGFPPHVVEAIDPSTYNPPNDIAF